MLELRANKIDAGSLYISEPNPAWFGNGPNPSDDTSWTCKNWLQSRFHFSFAEHRGGRQQFGVLRVMNDDLVQPHRGFGTHGHENMEIVTYIIDGELTHQDSMGTSESLGRGAIQFMTAGSGVRHSEYNHGDSPLRFIQMWILPSNRGLTPNYGSFTGDVEGRKNKLAHLVSDTRVANGIETPVKISQDANIFVSELEADKEVTFTLKSGRMGYLLCMEDSATIAAGGSEITIALERHAAVDLFGPADLTLKGGNKGAHLLFVEMAEQ